MVYWMGMWRLVCTVCRENGICMGDIRTWSIWSTRFSNNYLVNKNPVWLMYTRHEYKGSHPGTNIETKIRSREPKRGKCNVD